MVERGVAPAGVVRSHALGRPRVTVRPHYGGLPARAGRDRTSGAKAPCWGRWRAGRPSPGSTVPKPKIAAVKRREACRSASWAGGPSRWRDRPDRKAGHGVRRSAPAPVGASPPHIEGHGW